MKIDTLYRILSGFLSADKQNANSDRIEEAFQNTVSRDGSTPNNMQAPFDMGGHRIINLGAPANPNDAVRLQDIADLASGDLQLNTDWNNVDNKPATFPPSLHTHTSTDITDFQEAVEDRIGASIEAGSNVSISYNDATGKTTVSTTGALAGDWNTLVNKPATFAPSAHTHAEADVTGLTAALAGKANSVHTHVLADITDFVSAGGEASLEDYGAVGDGVTNDLAALQAAEADTSIQRVKVTKDYKITAALGTLSVTKAYGPGRLIVGAGAGTYFPGRFVHLTAKPYAGTGTDLTKFFTADISNIDAAYWRMGDFNNMLRVGVTEDYFESETVPHFEVMQSFQGYSGLTAFTTNSITTGATTVNLDLSVSGGDDLTPGRVFTFASGQDGTVYHTATSAGVVGSTLSFSPAVPSSTTIPSGAAVSIGKRTHNALYHSRFTHYGGGDAYVHVGAIEAAYQPTKGQRHVFNTSTVGLFGGSLTNTIDGNFMTGIEILHDGVSSDCAAIGAVLNFNRNSEIGARGAFWTGVQVKSEGTKPMNNGYALIGKFNIGIDLSTFTDFGTNRGAIGMKLGDRIWLDMQPRTGTDYTVVSDIYPVDKLFIGSDTVAGSKVIVQTAGLYKTILSAGGSFTLNCPMTSSGNIASSAEVSGASLKAASGTTTGRIYLGTLGNTYIDFNGSNITIVKNGSTVQTL